jgi:drug/metabolite transporter (DMT)-like permease
MNFKGEILALIAALGWVGSSLMFERASKRTSGFVMNIIRLFMALVILGILTQNSRGMALPFDVEPRTALFLAASGMMGLFIGDLALFKSYSLIGARVVMVIMTFNPILVALFGFIFLGERLNLNQLLAILITCIGILLVIYKPIKRESQDKEVAKVKNSEISKENWKKGLFYALVAMVAEATGILFTKIGSVQYDAFATTQVRHIPALIAFIIFISIRGEWKKVKSVVAEKGTMMYITLGTLAATMGVVALVEAMKFTKMGVVTTIAATSPILILPISIFIFKEKVSIKDIIGAVISTAGVILFFM